MKWKWTNIYPFALLYPNGRPWALIADAAVKDIRNGELRDRYNIIVIDTEYIFARLIGPTLQVFIHEEILK